MPRVEQTASYVLQDLNRIFQAALTCETEAELGQACLQVAVDVTGSEYGFIAEVREDGMLYDIAVSPNALELCRIFAEPGEEGPPGPFPVRGIYGEVLSQEAGLIVNEPGSYPARSGLPEGHAPVKSFLGVPLKESGRTFGVIGVANRPWGYGRDDGEALEAIAPAIVQAFKRKRVEVALRRSEDKYRSLFQSIDEGFCIVEVMFDEQGNPYDFRFLETNAVFEEQSGMKDVVGKTMRELEPAHEQSWFDAYGRIALTGQSERFVNGSDTLGRIWDVYGFRTDDPSQRHVAVLFRDITARIRMEAARLLLADVTDELARMTDITTALNGIVERVAAHFKAARVVFAEIGDAPNGSATVLYEWHVPELRPARAQALPDYPEAGFVGMPRSAKLSVVNDTEADVGKSPDSWPHQIRSFISVPLVSRTRWRFSMVVSDTKPREWRDDEVALAREIATHVWNAIDRSRNEAAEKRRLEEAERRAEEERRAAVHWLALSKIEMEIHSSLDIGEVARRALGEGADALGADSGAIDGLEEDGWVVWYDCGFTPSTVGRRYTSAENPHGDLAIDIGAVVAVDDVREDARISDEVVRRYNIRSFAVAPLVARGQPFGVLYFNYSKQHHFEQQEIEFISRLASSLSLAIDNAHLFATEHGIASILQDALLSLPAEVPGLEFAHAYHSATEAAWVGGDFYDLFELNDNLVGIVIGDVAGKGLDAAVLTSMVKNTIRAHAAERGKTPSRILELTNRVLYRATQADSFVTVFFGILDRRDGRFVYSNGGHTTSIIVRPGGQLADLEATGPVLGAIADASFEECSVELDAGDILFLYTDGLTEARRGRDLYGEERLRQFLASVTDSSAMGLVERVIDEVMAYTDKRLRDDLALLAVRRVRSDESTPPPQRLTIGSEPTPGAQGNPMGIVR